MELRKCPFCGGEAEETNWFYGEEEAAAEEEREADE